ncbi:unnamed protein product [Mytilus coruscus]|uniref:F5/8 type C domain-containing protein n=1 Tax=Mytilus coruscus TaxID=42192 RepID=A0A6J8B454_MYTCO|nr:unnamed protein product [Mytilus coruscus]
MLLMETGQEHRSITVFFCAHSDRVANQKSWWAVDLQNVYTINGVDIFGRTDCCPEYLANFDVEIILPICTCRHWDWNNLEEGDKFSCGYQETESQRVTINCPPNTKGRYVRIKRRLANIITTYACGQIGYGYAGPVIGTSVAQGNIQCTSTCITKTECFVAEYDKNTHVCTLKGECSNGTQSHLYPDNNKHVFLIQMDGDKYVLILDVNKEIQNHQ